MGIVSYLPYRGAAWVGVVLLSVLVQPSWAQTAPAPTACALTLAGRVADQRTGEALPGTVLRLDETGAAEAADPDGHYHFHGLCAGTYHLRGSFVGFGEAVLVINLKSSTLKNIALKADAQQLGNVQVTGEREEVPLVSQQQTTLSGAALQQTRGLSLGEALKGITGVYSIQTGPTISKPVIHGLYGNRVLILNNGVRQEGQQWSSDHAPEIDPFTATRLSVIKGAASIRYGADAIGGVVLVEPAALPDTAGVSGELNLVGMSNSRLGAVSGFMQTAIVDSSSAFRGLSARLQGTLRGSGNARTANYYLNNTGLREKNFSAALGYHRGRVGGEAFFSRFDTRLGIFSGSETGSITDLTAAIGRERPLTPDVFSYTVARPYQAVVHELLKVRAHADLLRAGTVEATFARQTDARSEYGDQLPFNPVLGDVPDLYLSLTTHTLDLAWTTPKGPRWSATVGMAGSTQANVRAYEFLIPNFRNYGAGLYALGKHTGERLTLEAGLRYDYRWLRAFFLNNNTVTVEMPTTIYQAVTGTLGSVLDLGSGLTLSANLGTAWRPPTVNELYAAGVHQSAATYEQGNAALTREQAYNSTVSLSYTNSRVEAEMGGYVNYIRNYIFLRPALRYIRTVRGAYPVFEYTQADAIFRGIDAHVSYRPVPTLTATTALSLLWAYNQTAGDYLIYAPPQRLQTSLRYAFGAAAGGPYLEINNLLVARQTRAPQDGDYAPPPAGYVLWGAAAGTTLHLGHQPVEVSLSATNLLNAEYRDYLNRFRYYAADLGRNVQLRLRVPFGFR